MPGWLTPRVKVLLILATLALALNLWERGVPRAPRTTPPAQDAPASDPSRLPDAVQQLLGATKGAPKPTLSPGERQAMEARARGTWGRDPFALEAARPKKQIEAQPPNFAAGLHLSGIVWDGTHMHAVINDSLVKVGGEVEGIRIVAIERDRVTLAKGNQRKVLRLDQ
jgi:hypothetical protein